MSTTNYILLSFTETSTFSHHDDEIPDIVTSSNQGTGITYPVVVVIGTVSCIFGVFIWYCWESTCNFIDKKEAKVLL